MVMSCVCSDTDMDTALSCVCLDVGSGNMVHRTSWHFHVCAWTQDMRHGTQQHCHDCAQPWVWVTRDMGTGYHGTITHVLRCGTRNIAGPSCMCTVKGHSSTVTCVLRHGTKDMAAQSLESLHLGLAYTGHRHGTQMSQ